MILIVLSSENLSRVGIIDNPISVVWNNKYFSSGDFQITVDSNEYTRNILKKNSFIIRQDVNEEIGIIETIARIGEKDAKGKLIISGRFAHSILSRRVVWGKTLLNGELLPQLQNLIDINAINPIDENGTPIPERTLVIGIKKEGVMTTSYERKTGESVQLHSIIAGIKRTRQGSGLGSDYRFTTQAEYQLATNTTLVAFSSTDVGTANKQTFGFGHLYKNYYSQVADTIEIKGNRYVRKIRNIYNNTVKQDILDCLAEYREYIYNDIYSRPVVPTDYGVFNPNMTCGMSKDYKDIGINLGLGSFPFSNAFNIETSKRDTTDLYIYQEGNFLVFANSGEGVSPTFTNFDTIIDPMLTRLKEIISGWTDDVFIMSTYDKELESEWYIYPSIIPQDKAKYGLIDDNTDIYNLSPVSTMLLEVTSGSEENKYLALNSDYPSISASLYEIVKGNNLLEYVEKALQNNGLGLKAVYSASDKKIYLTFYSGEDKSKKVIFSRELDSLSGYEVTETTQGKYNVVRISGEKEEEEIWTESGIGSGLDRNETYEEIGDLKGFSEIDYIQAMQNSGNLSLQGFSVAIGAEIIAESYKYRQEYNLGDIVTINIKEIDLSYNARVLEVCETWDNSGYKITLVLGE